MKFEELNVKPEIVKALKLEGIKVPTKIQEKTIPLIKSGRDVIGRSKTGSGKTAAFSIPILEKIVPRGGIQVLVIAPTRELAHQISGEIKKFGKYINFSIATVFGGVSLKPQIDAMRRSEIVVGTPGRLLDHLRRGNLNLSRLNCFILDEADKLVEMGFIEDITIIIDSTPKNRQILLFGATVSNEINRIKQNYMHNSSYVETEEHVEEEYLEQYYYDISQHEKFSLLVHLLKKEETERVIIFCSTRLTVDIVAKNLRAQRIRSALIHGKLTQNKRLRVISDFNRGKVKVLVASAVAARGLDIKDVTHIFNYDLSQDPQEYVHRIGRTARAGQSGKAITLLSSRDHDVFRDIHDRYQFEVRELPQEKFQRLRFDARSHQSNQGRFGGRNFNRNPNRYVRA